MSEENNTQSLARWDEKRNIVTEMETCYLDYAMSVIVGRALPDVRDGMKPVHRRILYAMHESGMRATSKYKKSARVVGDVLGKYHPHGDTSVYDAMVRMAQDFSLRYPLIDGQGNFWSMDGDNAAAMRYTEARMSKIADVLMSDIDKDTVDWQDNYDGSTQEPRVLPTRLPNLLLNGTSGIAVGMATNIPPHNLTEVVDAILYILRHENPKNIEITDLMQFIKGPDFPTGGIIYNNKDILNAYATGRGSVVMRGVANIEELKNGRNAIIITEVPYQVNKSALVEKIADLVRDKIIVGISDLRDESNKESVRVVVELKKDAFPKKILNQLFKSTQLQTSFPFNMIALHNGGIQPKLFNLLEILEEFIVHRRDVVTRRTRYELNIAEARAHILEGLKIALDHIDAIIKTIKASKTKELAKEALQLEFKLSEKQAQAILEMQLQKLSGLERQKIEDELAEKLLLISDLKDILVKPERVNTIVGEELEEVREKYKDIRKTQVHVSALGEFNPKDTIPNEEVIITLSDAMYVKRMKQSVFRTQRRGGKWVTTATKTEDEIKILLSTRNHNDLLFFTSQGRVFTLPVYEIPETSRTAKGQPIVNLLNLQKNEKIATVLDISATSGKTLFLGTKKATVKRIDIESVKNIRSSGLIVMKVPEGDELGWVRTTTGDGNILIVSKKGQAIQFNENDVRIMGRAAAGVRGIRLKSEDEVVEIVSISDLDAFVFSVTQTGMGKITEIGEYRTQNRGGSGIKVSAITKKTGDIIWVYMLSEEDRQTSNMVLISRSGQTVRMSFKGIRKIGRVSQGVILTRLKDKKDALVSVGIIRKDDEEGNE